MYFVNKNAKTQWLMIGNELEGKVYRHPSAAAFGCDIDGPGAISASAYTYSFILPAWLNPDGHGLVLGLGSGAGIVLLLTLFPQLKLTVIELSKEVLHLVKQHFPLVAHYIQLGRLTVQCKDAVKFCAENKRPFDFTIVDIYRGDGNYEMNLHCFTDALLFSKYVLANLMTNFSDAQRDDLLKKQENTILFSATHVYVGNWILTNISQIPSDLTLFQPFKVFEAQSATTVKQANTFFFNFLKQIPASCFYYED